MYPREDPSQYGSQPPRYENPPPPYSGQSTQYLVPPQQGGQQYGDGQYGANVYGGSPPPPQPHGAAVQQYDAPPPPYGSPPGPPLAPEPPPSAPYSAPYNGGGKSVGRTAGSGIGAVFGMLFARVFGRLILSLGATVIGLAVVGGIGWYAYSKYADQIPETPGLSSDAPRTAEVGECLEQSGSAEEDLAIVDCKAPTAEYKVAGKVPNVFESTFNTTSEQLCSRWAKTETAYWEGIEGRTGTVLCLEPAKPSK